MEPSSSTQLYKDKFDLIRFINVQDQVYVNVLHELRSGKKIAHWMWFIFPQIIGLGRSARSLFFALTSLEEAKVYYNHSLLGNRLIECSKIVQELERRTIKEIFGNPDYHKFRSCMTLFAELEGADPVFQNNLAKYFLGKPDKRTLEILEVLKNREPTQSKTGIVAA